MDQFFDFFSRLFDTDSWPPRWHCGEWTDFHGWLYIISDLAISTAYFTIPFLLIHFILRKKNVPFPRIFWLFGTFILACGATHLIDAVIFWAPVYRVSALVRFITALASWGTIFALYRILPDAFSLKTPAELEKVVTERTEQLHLSVQKMRFLADAMPQMVWTAKPDGAVDYYNAPMLTFTGKSMGQLADWSWTEIIHPEDRDDTLQKWNESINNGTEFYIEQRLKNTTGEFHWHLTRALAQKDEEGNVLMWVGTSTNIEPQKRATEILERTVAERTEELRKVNEELLISNEGLEKFAAIASHDLQAPLRTISNYIGLVQEEDQLTLSETSKQYITRITAATRRMSALVHDLLSYTKINATAVKIVQVDLNVVIKNVFANLDELIKSHQAVVVCPDLPTIPADQLQMTQLFQNLVSNGIKYNDNPQPTVKISFEKRALDYLFTASDNGVGMAEAHLDKVFDVFTRLQSDKQGTGLGLSISKSIVEKHGGRIWIESKENMGTTFFFNLPHQSV